MDSSAYPRRAWLRRLTRLTASALVTLAAVALVVRSPGSARWQPRPRQPVGGALAVLRRVAPAGAGLVDRWRVRLERDRSYADLPLALDLLACVLRAGQPPSTAAAAVAIAVRGPVGEMLLAVARAADLGAPADIAWQPLGRLTSVAAVARTAARSAESGTRLADELADMATDLRARRAAATDARVRRAGVLVVLPLGMCFLPAFVLIGVVPIVIGIAGTVLR